MSTSKQPVISLGVHGALGRMGKRVLQLAAESENFKIVAAFEKGDSLPAKALEGCSVLVDFSSPEGTMRALSAAVEAGTPLVIGTTGLGADQERQIRQAASKIAILMSPNMSVGANLLFEMARLAASKLKGGYDVEIVEAHHRLKKDAPSGTAKRIAQIIAKEKGNEVGIHSIRAGDIVGEHTVLFSGSGETVELIHRAHSRDAFARGALVAACFLATKKNGFYTMADVL